MSLPTLVKTWQLVHTTVAALGTGSLDIQRGLRTGVVNALLGVGSPPTVLGSSDASTAALDNTNRWTADNKLVWANAGTAHSWIVFQFGVSKFQLCIDLSNSSLGTITIVASASAGFTGGTIQNRPTATDEVPAISNGGWVNSFADSQRVWHVWVPTDGSAVRVLMYRTNLLESWWVVELPIDTTIGWTDPLVAQVAFSNSLDGYPTYGNLYNVASTVNAKGPSGAFTVAFTSEALPGSAVGQLQTVPNGIDGGYPFMPIGLYSSTAGSIGRHGVLQDLWWGSTFPNTGDFYPNDASRQFVQIGDLIYPWDGSAVLATA